jgi:hypothetical protein
MGSARLGWVAVALAMTGGLGAAPATRPAGLPKDWVKVENATNHFAFAVPKAWQQNQKSDTQMAYFLPHTYAKHPSLFMVVAGACHESDVKKDADETRTQFQSSVVAHGGKITRDEATTLGGEPAWVFELQVPYVVPPDPGAAPAKAAGIKRTTKLYEVLRAEGNMDYIVTFEADAQFYTTGVATVKKVLDTFTWGATTTP